jgi:hypothetical protein
MLKLEELGETGVEEAAGRRWDGRRSAQDILAGEGRLGMVLRELLGPPASRLSAVLRLCKRCLVQKRPGAPTPRPVQPKSISRAAALGRVLQQRKQHRLHTGRWSAAQARTRSASLTYTRTQVSGPDRHAEDLHLLHHSAQGAPCPTRNTPRGAGSLAESESSPCKQSPPPLLGSGTLQGLAHALHRAKGRASPTRKRKRQSQKGFHAQNASSVSTMCNYRER